MLNKKTHLTFLLAALLLVLTACSSSDSSDQFADEVSVTDEIATPTPTLVPRSGQTIPPADIPEEKYRIVTLLPRDAIPAIDNPIFLPAPEAALSHRPDELVMGVSYNGESHAYSVGVLSSHEIVNDTVGGRKIAVTW